MERSSDQDRSPRLQQRSMNVWTFFTTALCLLLLAKDSSQAEYSFTDQPVSYYYFVYGESAVIPCAAEVINEDGTAQPVSTTLIFNGEALDIHGTSETRLFAQLADNVVIGLLLLSAMETDHKTTFECAVRQGDQTVLSVSSTIYVGDGRPLKPISNPVQTADTVHSLSIDWGESPVPSHAPVTHYTILLVELLEEERDIFFNPPSNNTNAEVPNLLAGVMYRIYVYGVNLFGEGQRSSYVIGMTASPMTPPSPVDVRVEVVDRGNVCDVIITWTVTPVEVDVMTPITNFVIYYGRDEDSLNNFTTPNADITRYNMSGWTEKGAWLVGVASLNSAGTSTPAYIEITLETDNIDTPDTTSQKITTQTNLGTDPEPASSLDLTTIVGIAVGCFVILIVILIILVIICTVRHRIKRMERDHFDIPTPIDKLDRSPSAKRKGTLSPKHNESNKRESNSSYSSTELHDYGNEPRRAGSRTPPPTTDYV